MSGEKELQKLWKKFNGNLKLIRFKHYPLEKAEKKLSKARKKKYILKTINTTFFCCC